MKFTSCIFIIIIVAVASISFSCHNPVDGQPGSVPKGIDTTKDQYTWTLQRFGNGSNPIVHGVWANSPQDYWICGLDLNTPASNGLFGIGHFSNGNWTYYAQGGDSGVGNPIAVYGTSPTNIWFVESGGLFLQWTGGPNFNYYYFYPNTQQPYIQNWPYSYSCIWVAPDGEVFSGADSGRVLHLKADGQTWELLRAPTTYHINNIVGFAPNNIYVSSGYSNFNGMLLHWDGNSWSNIPIDSSLLVGNFDVWGESPDSLILAGDGLFHRTATGWKNITPSGALYYLGGAYSNGYNNLFITGEDNYVAKWDGLKWIRFQNEFSPNLSAVIGVYMNKGEVFIYGQDQQGAMLHIGQ